MSVRVVASVTSAEEVLLEALATLEAAVAEVAAATSAVAEEGVAVTGVMIVAAVAVAVGVVTEEIAAGIEASAAAATMMTLAGES